jgi:hypothetical protein
VREHYCWGKLNNIVCVWAVQGQCDTVCAVITRTKGTRWGRLSIMLGPRTQRTQHARQTAAPRTLMSPWWPYRSLPAP